MQLADATIDPELSETRRLLAAVAHDEGYYEAQELAEAVLEVAHEANAGVSDPASPARTRMRAILERNLDYQHELFQIVAFEPLADAAADLCWLAAIMKGRPDMPGPVTRARS